MDDIQSYIKMEVLYDVMCIKNGVWGFIKFVIKTSKIINNFTKQMWYSVGGCWDLGWLKSFKAVDSRSVLLTAVLF
jgi:hypothetical protein